MRRGAESVIRRVWRVASILRDRGAAVSFRVVHVEIASLRVLVVDSMCTVTRGGEAK